MTILEYYIATAIFTFCCSLFMPSKLSLSDNLSYSALLAVLMGWFMWPVALIAIIRLSIKKIRS